MRTLSIRTKIYLGIAFILGLLVVNGLVSYWGLGRLREQVALRQQASGITQKSQNIDRYVQELRLRVDRYVVTGHESLQDRVVNLNKRIGEELASIDTDRLDKGVADRFSRISVNVDEYLRHFDSVVRERRIRESLVHDELPEQAAKVRHSLATLASSLADDPGADAQRLRVAKCQTEFAIAERAFLNYFEAPDTAAANAGVDAAELVMKLAAEGSTDELWVALNDAITEYERIGLRAVQATRSYLFLRNVLMAGEAAEVSYNAQKLREIADAEQAAIDGQLVRVSDTVNRVTATMVAVAIAMSLVIAGRLAVDIVQPITALTRSFRRLSEGETIDEIPGSARHDEIGSMAEAARVFSRQNQQTRDLLARSEELGKELQRQTEVLATTNDELDSFAYVASHDLKSPLRGIRQLATWIVEDSADKLEGNSRIYLEQMRSRVEKMEDLLDELLRYSRVGRMDAEQEEVDVDELLDEVIGMTDNPSGVEIRRPEDLPRFTTLRSPLKQVLLNLVGNAIKHNHLGPDGVVELNWAGDDDHYRVTVSDNGPGIDPVNHERVFQMYQRVGDSAVEGSGMGLALVKKQVENLGGSVSLDSTLGDGARFTFTWPTHHESN